jgi:hypothetical protein
MNKSATHKTAPAPAVPGFETLFGLVKLSPIDSLNDRASEMFEALLDRDHEAWAKARTTPGK